MGWDGMGCDVDIGCHEVDIGSRMLDVGLEH